MARGRELKVYLTSDVSKFGRGLRQAEGRLGKFKKIAGGALAGVATAAGAAAVAFGVEGVQAAVEDESAAKKLAKTLQNLGKAQDVDRAEEFIDSLMKQTGIADDELRPAFEKLVQATGDTDEAMALLRTSVDTAVGAGKPLATVTSAIAKSMDGQVGALSRLVPGLDTAAAKADPLNSIMEQLNRRFGGQAATRMDTFAGKSEAIATAWGELQESFGKGLLGALEGSGEAMGGMDETLYTLGPAMEDFGKIIGDMAVNVATIARTLGPVVEKFNELNDMGGGILTDGTLTTALKSLARINFMIAAMNGDTAGMAMYANDAGIPGVSGGVNPEADTLYTAEQKRKAALTFSSGPTPYFGSGDLYRATRFKPRANDAGGRGDARGAQREARTRQQP